MLKHILKLVAICAFAVCTMGAMKAEAQTTTIVRLDNWLNPSKDPVAKSVNPVTVWVFDGSWHGWTRTLNAISSAWDFTIQGVNPYWVSTIEVDAGGPDMFVLDQMELYDEVGNKINTWGLDNEKGWCLSTMSSDGTNSHCDSSGALPWFQFSTGR